jgi:large subunit ribosomal protein L24
MVSSKARNQRKMRANAPTHVKRKMLSSHLSADLQKEYGKRSARVCVGDTVLVLRGGEGIRGTEGKVIGVMTDEGRITIEGVTINQADNTAVARPVHASNVVITKLNLDDAWRKDALKRGKGAKQ